MNVGDDFALPTGVRWLDRPPLRCEVACHGHVVVVLAWRLGCVHSRDALVETARLVDEFVGRPVALLAVHTPLAAAERDDERLRRTLQLLDVVAAHAIDDDGALLHAGAATALPMLWLVDAEGVVRTRGAGVPFRRRLHDALLALVDEARERGRAARVPFAPCAPRPVLALGPTAVFARGGRTWVAAAARRQLLALDGDGSVQAIGSGGCGADDGEAGRATMRWPTAIVALDAGTFVADALAHTLRHVAADGYLDTWWGNGRRSTDHHGGAYGTDQSLASPAAAIAHEGSLLVAMAGAHQLWQCDPTTRAAMAWLGSGDRGSDDGTRPAFCEPAAVLVHEAAAWVADAGSGALRAIDLAHQSTRTVHTGLGRPVALAWHCDALLVAASWQPAILRCPNGEGAPQPLFTRAHGLVEPVALALDGDRLLVADLGADCVFVADLAAPTPTLSRLAIAAPPLASPATNPTRAQRLVPARLAEHSDVRVRVPLPAANDVAIEDLGTLTIDVVDEATPVLACARNTAGKGVDGHVEVLLPVAAAGLGAVRIVVRGELRAGARHREFVWRYVLPVLVVADGARELTLARERT